MFIISYLVFMAENWKDLSFIEIEERELCIDLIEVIATCKMQLVFFFLTQASSGIFWANF